MFNTYLCSRGVKLMLSFQMRTKNGNISDMMPYN